MEMSGKVAVYDRRDLRNRKKHRGKSCWNGPLSIWAATGSGARRWSGSEDHPDL